MLGCLGLGSWTWRTKFIVKGPGVVAILQSLTERWYDFRGRWRDGPLFVAVVALAVGLVVALVVSQPGTGPAGVTNDQVPAPAPQVRGTVIDQPDAPIPGPSVANQDRP